MSDGFELVKKYEAYREFAYPDPMQDLGRKVREAGIKARWGFEPANDIIATLPLKFQDLSGKPWTCGYGETKGVTPETRWSQQDALAKFRRRYREFEDGVLKACKVEPTAEQLGAMTSLAYNIGLGWEGKTKPPGAKGGFRQSSVLKAHNRGDTLAASRAFGLWNKANHREEPGLTARRAAEAALYLTGLGDYQDEDAAPAQVDAERPMTASQINRAGVVAGGTAAVATVAETARTIADVKDATADLGTWLVPILLLLVVGLCGYIVWQRIFMRKEGWV